MSLMDDLIKQYKDGEAVLSQKEKARIEQDLWDLTTPEDRKTEYRRDYLKRILGLSISETEARSRLLNAGPDVQVLWDRVERKELSIRTASDILARARQHALQVGIRLSESLPRYIEEYDSRANVRTTPNGAQVRYDFKHKIREDLTKESQFWVALGNSIVEFVESKWPAIDPSDLTILTKEFKTDLKIITSHFQSKIQRAVERNSSTKKAAPVAVDRKSLIRACITLHMDPPKDGAPVDMVKVSKQKRVLARTYHPDTTGGDEVLNEKYLAVMEAFDVLEAYSKQSTPTGSNNANLDSEAQ